MSLSRDAQNERPETGSPKWNVTIIKVNKKYNKKGLL